MTNFEKIISDISKKMTVQKVAELIIDRYNYDNTINNYCTDNGNYCFHIDALKAEIEWLQQEVKV